MIQRVILLACFTIVCAAVSAAPATILFGQRIETADSAVVEKEELWLSPDDLAKTTGFVLKPEGACLKELCIPVKAGDKAMLKEADGKKLINLSGLARKLNQAVVADHEKNVFSFGPVPAIRASELESAVAPDFELPDMEGNMHKLSDFRGKKTLILTWASWCGCSLDLPGWEKVYEELKDKNFVLLAAAQDSGGPDAARKAYTRANPTFIPLVDQFHTISTLYRMVNVPTGVWIDEKGNIVRPPEVAYSSNVQLGEIKVEGAKYVDALRDWVEKGDKSAYAMKPADLKKHLPPGATKEDLADANFHLGVYFHLHGDEPRANQYWEAAQKLHPDSWNYHRQDWSFTPKEAMKNWSAKVKALGDKPYYAPLDLSAPAKP